MCKIPLQALNEIVYDPKYADVNIRRVVANAIERHESTVSRVLSDQAKLDQEQAARLGRELCDRLDETRWSRCFVGNTYLLVPRPRGSANGVWDDETARLMEAGGAWQKAMNEGNKAAANEALNTIRSLVVPDMQAEADRL